MSVSEMLRGVSVHPLFYCNGTLCINHKFIDIDTPGSSGVITAEYTNVGRSPKVTKKLDIIGLKIKRMRFECPCPGDCYCSGGVLPELENFTEFEVFDGTSLGIIITSMDMYQRYSHIPHRLRKNHKHITAGVEPNFSSYLHNKGTNSYHNGVFRVQIRDLDVNHIKMISEYEQIKKVIIICDRQISADVLSSMGHILEKITKYVDNGRIRLEFPAPSVE